MIKKYRVNGFDVFDNAGASETYLANINQEYDRALLASFGRQRAEHQEFDLSLVLLSNDEDLQAHFKEIIKDIGERYSPLYSKYKKYHYGLSRTSVEKACFIYMNGSVDVSKCRLKVFDDIIQTRLDATALANQTKLYLYTLIYFVKPTLRDQLLLIQLFKTLESASRKRVRGTGLRVFDELVFEIDLFENDHLSEVFKSFLGEVVPDLQTRIKSYAHDPAAFRSSRCRLCHYQESDELHRWIEKWSFLRVPSDSSGFLAYVFKKTFYQTLSAFLKEVQRNDPGS